MSSLPPHLLAIHRKLEHAARREKEREAAASAKLEQARAVCARKRPYPTESKALACAFTRFMKLDPAARAPRLYAYQCPICQNWHLTKIPH